MADGRMMPKDIANTVHRDINWFVRNADATIAYFPYHIQSMGTAEELRATLRLGKPAILIKPPEEGKPVGEAFGLRPALHVTDSQSFIDIVHGSRYAKEKNDPLYAFLQRLLDPYQDIPRYANLRPYAVAVDIQRDGKHLLGMQAPGKALAGNWMLIAGKKDGRANGQVESDVEALVREAWQEIGVKLVGVHLSYRSYPVDYAKKGTGIQYVRIYRATDIEGKIKEDNVVKHPEIAKVGWFSAEEIMKMENVVPATMQYFRELAAREEPKKQNL